MPRDIGLVSKKRQHPDGLQELSCSLPKRVFSSSEAETSSLIDSASVFPGNPINPSKGSLCHSASSALIYADCSTSTCPVQTRDSASFKLEGAGSIHSVIPSPRESTKLRSSSSEHAAPGGTIGFVLSRMSSDASRSKCTDASSMHSSRPCKTASYSDEALRCTKESLVQGKDKGIWTYRSASAKREGLGCEGELSEVTFEKSSRRPISRHGASEDSGSEKTTHVISRRNVSTVSSSNELWHKAAHGQGDYVSRGKLFRGASQRADASISSVACESASSCATGKSHIEEIRQQQTFAHSYWSNRDESSATLSHTSSRTAVLVGSRSLERSEWKNNHIFQGRSHSEASLNLLPWKATPEDPSLSYILSSGRMSLEEEARLGRRAPTIDHDFEEYFSSLML